MLPLVRLPLRLDRGNSHVTGKEILAALEKLAKMRNYFVKKTLEKYYESGQYYSLALVGVSLSAAPINVLISVGDIDSARSEIKLNESYHSWNVYVENKRDNPHFPNLGSKVGDEEIIACVKEIRDQLGQILMEG